MLQFLPNLELAARRRPRCVISGLLRRRPQAEREAAWNAVKAILSSPVAAPLFGEESRAEVAIMGKLTIRGRERVVSGTINRLAVTAERF
jgi:ATP-dependent helicase/nuclease subunit A